MRIHDKMYFVLADGSIKKLHEEDDLIDAVRVSLGVLGVMSTITFKCEPIIHFTCKRRS